MIALALMGVNRALAAGEAGAVSTLIQVPGRTITSSGDAAVFVVPDEAVVSFGIETFNSDLDHAKSLNDEASRHGCSRPSGPWASRISTSRPTPSRLS